MRFPTQEFNLPNGLPCTLRSPEPEDAAALLDYLRVTSGETENVVRYPEEVTMSEAEEGAFLQQCAASERQVMLAVFGAGQVLGSAGVNPMGEQVKLRHRAEVGISLQKAYWGMGLGTCLMETAIDLARQMGYEQLELEVRSDNARAKRLYEKLGFASCGEIPHAFRLRNGEYASLIPMVKFL
ncbi:MAG: GNAT family N-acetyltransferase [Clostridiales bacterium]|nr:GNAT family N-acetyltransferase [Clostridiales bacterium]